MNTVWEILVKIGPVLSEIIGLQEGREKSNIGRTHSHSTCHTRRVKQQQQHRRQQQYTCFYLVRVSYSNHLCCFSLSRLFWVKQQQQQHRRQQQYTCFYLVRVSYSNYLCCFCLSRLFWVDLIKPVSNVRPSTQSFFDFSEIWHVGRGWWVMYGGMQYDPIQGQGHEPFKFGNSVIFKSYLLHRLQWELASDHGFLN